MRMALRLMFWLTLGFIAFVTLSPIGDRPVTPFGANEERFAAFFAVSLLLMMAYPARRLTWFVLLVVGAGLLEASQNIVPGRHGRLHDFEFKTLGILCGGALGVLLERFLLGRHSAAE